MAYRVVNCTLSSFERVFLLFGDDVHPTIVARRQTLFNTSELYLFSRCVVLASMLSQREGHHSLILDGSVRNAAATSCLEFFSETISFYKV